MLTSCLPRTAFLASFATHQAFDNLQQFLHHHGDALIAQQPAHDFDVWGTHKVPVGAKYAAVCQVQCLQSQQGDNRQFRIKFMHHGVEELF